VIWDQFLIQKVYPSVFNDGGLTLVPPIPSCTTCTSWPWTEHLEIRKPLSHLLSEGDWVQNTSCIERDLSVVSVRRNPLLVFVFRTVGTYVVYGSNIF